LVRSGLPDGMVSLQDLSTPLRLELAVCDAAEPQRLFLVHSSNFYGQTALSLAVKAGELQAVEILLAAGASMQAATPVRIIASKIKGNAAVSNTGDFEFELGPGLVQRNCEFNAEIKKPSSSGLHFLAKEAGGIPSAPYTVHASFGQAAEACISSGDELLTIQGKSASSLDFPRLCRLLRQRPVWLRFRKGQGLHRTPLQLAAAQGRLEIVKLLLQKQANANVQDEFGLTAMDLAVQKQHVEIVKELLSAGAKTQVLIHDATGSSKPLQWPAHWKSVQMNGDPLLDVWHLGSRFKHLSECNSMVPFFQAMFDQTFIAKKTRDRRDKGQLPTRLEVLHVELVANATNFKEYQQRKKEILSRRGASDPQLQIPGGVRTDMDWSSALQQLGCEAVKNPLSAARHQTWCCKIYCPFRLPTVPCRHCRRFSLWGRSLHG